MFVTIINDCRDENTMGRQATRIASLFPGAHITTVGIGWSEIEGAGNLIDMLDASNGQEGIILANVAPRHGRGKKWPNGTPFGYFYYKKTLIISTIAEQMLSLVKKFDIADSLRLTDVATVIDLMITKGKLEKESRDRIVHSQFRSFDYVPYLARWIIDKEKFPTEAYSFSNVADLSHSIWWVDNFGNYKTTALPGDIAFAPGKKVATKIGKIICYERMKDVPNDEKGVIIGSSGLGNRRFLEVIVQGGVTSSAYFHLKIGDKIF